MSLSQTVLLTLLAILVRKLPLGNEPSLKLLLHLSASTSAQHSATKSVESAMKGVDGLGG